MSASRRMFRASACQRRGATVVEFALTAPILFAIVLAAIEFSRANMLMHTASIAATEAARKSIIPGATASEVRLKAIDELHLVGIVDATVTVTPADIVDDTTEVSVDLNVPVTLRNGFGLARLFLGKNVFKSVTLQREGKKAQTTTETPKRDGVQTGNGNGNNGNGNGNGNNGNGNGNGGGNGSNGNSSGNSSGSNSGNGNSGS